MKLLGVIAQKFLDDQNSLIDIQALQPGEYHLPAIFPVRDAAMVRASRSSN